MILSAIGRGVALFFGVFSLLNLGGSLLRRHFDMSLWWIDLRILNVWIARAILLAAAVLLVALGLLGPGRPWRKRSTAALLLALAAAAGVNSVMFYMLWHRGEINPGVPVPMSVFVLVALGVTAFALRHRQGDKETGRQGAEVPVRRLSLSPCLLVSLSSFTLCLLAFPLGQIFCFGKTSYERPADAAVVLGARVYADGRMSDALADRVRSGVDLYTRGVVRTLVFSGGPGDGQTHETEAMRRYAIDHGVKDEDIILDKRGLNTSATAANVTALARDRGWTTVLAVSHYFHLPRTKMAFQREGLTIYTVPARESYILTQTPYLLAREVVALWAYYLMIPT